jgi:peptidoglycan/xylan/chitin deacetylase (PgdA/CDA1 family)
VTSRHPRRCSPPIRVSPRYARCSAGTQCGRLSRAPAIIAHIHRDLLRSLTAEGHEIAAHGFRHEDVSGLERNEERQRIARTTEILADVTGRKPDGWFSLPRQGDRYAVGAVSPNTVDLLLDAGYLYLGNGLADQGRPSAEKRSHIGQAR